MPDSSVGLSVSRLLDEIREHKRVIREAGTVRVDSRDTPIARRKHEADRRLWALLDEALIEEARVGLGDAQRYNARKRAAIENFDESRWSGPID